MAKTGNQDSSEPEITRITALIMAEMDCVHPVRFEAKVREILRAEFFQEKVTMDGDWLICLCDNAPDMDGFTPCLDDGTKVEPLSGTPWDLYLCLQCGRIIDRYSLLVTGRVAL